jgi:hypothetical protein
MPLSSWPALFWVRNFWTMSLILIGSLPTKGYDALLVMYSICSEQPRTSWSPFPHSTCNFNFFPEIVQRPRVRSKQMIRLKIFNEKHPANWQGSLSAYLANCEPLR